jgi:uncharacterized membrane protein
MSSWVGASVLSLGEWIIKHMPLVRHIYNASKQISAAISPGKLSFKKISPGKLTVALDSMRLMSVLTRIMLVLQIRTNKLSKKWLL